jgi:hypothetical protein
LRRIATEGEVSVLLRNSLASHYPLPGEVVDLLIRHADPKAYHTPGQIAHRKDLTPAQIEALYFIHPYEAGAKLIARPDFPAHLFEKAAETGSFDTLASLVDNPAAPLEVIQKAFRKMLESDSYEILRSLVQNPAVPPVIVQGALRKILQTPSCHHCGAPYVGILLVAEHPLIPDELQTELAAHPAPQVREALACNAVLAIPLLKQLAADPFACVAASARQGLNKNPAPEITAFLTSLPALDTLRPEKSAHSVALSALKTDDPVAFRTFHNDAPTTTLIELGAIRCLRDQMSLGNQTPESLAFHAFSKGWNAEMTELVLGEAPAPETVELLAKSIVGRGEANDLAIFERRNLDLAFIRKTPLMGIAVSRRDGAMLKRLAALHADPEIRIAGLTAAQLAVRARFTEAVDLLPLDAEARAELEAFHKRFPGDPKAAWLGDWTNRKSGFDVLGAQFRPDGSGTLITSIGMGIPIAWVQPDTGRPEFEITAFDEKGEELPQVFKAQLQGEKLKINLGDRNESFVRPKLSEP